MGSRDLSSKTYANQLILICDMKFGGSDQFEEGKQFQDLLSTDNVYILPKEVKYDEYVNK